MNKYLLACSGAFVLAVAACAQEGPGGMDAGSRGLVGEVPPPRARPAPAATATAGTTGNAGTGGEQRRRHGQRAAPRATPARARQRRHGTRQRRHGRRQHRRHGRRQRRHGWQRRDAAAPAAAPPARPARPDAAAPAAAAAGTTGAAGRGGTGGAAAAAAPAAAARSTPSVIVPGFDGYYWEATPSGNTALSGTNYPFGPAEGGRPYRRDLEHDRLHRHQAGADRGRHGRHEVHDQHQRPRRRGHALLQTGGTAASTAAGVGPARTTPGTRWSAVQRQHLEHAGDSRRAADHCQANDGSVQRRLRHLLHNSFNTSAWCPERGDLRDRYNASFPVTGGGTITLVNHDSNCRTLANCGAVEQQTSCNSSRRAHHRHGGRDPGGDGPGRRTFTQPRTGSLAGSTYYLQWVWFDVTSVTSP